MMVKNKKKLSDVVEFFKLTKAQQNSIRPYLDQYYCIGQNGSTIDVTLEKEEMNPITKLLMKLGYKDGDTVIIRFSW